MLCGACNVRFMLIHFAADHAGFNLKEKLKAFLQERGYEIKDHGAFVYDENDDYPDFMHLAVKAVAENPEHNRGIFIGGSGQGEATIAARYRGIRIAVCDDAEKSEEKAKTWREHNDSNVLAIGARFVPEEVIKRVLLTWLETPFSGEERHKRRIAKIDR